jgi:predicted nucleic acid-binding protein
MAGSFLDSNVIIHFAGAGDHANRAERLLKQGGTISVQVLNEVTSVCRKKLGFSWREIDAVVERLMAALDVVPVTVATHELSRRIAERYKLAFYDSALLAAALIAECDIFWSQDLHDGLVIGERLTIRNPFA